MLRINLIEKSNELMEDIQGNQAWFEREVSFVVDGSHKSGYELYKHIQDTYKADGKRLGKNGSNLIAYVGNQAIQDIYNINHNQALKVWNYTDSGTKKYLDNLVSDLIIEMMENQ